MCQVSSAGCGYETVTRSKRSALVIVARALSPQRPGVFLRLAASCDAHLLDELAVPVAARRHGASTVYSGVDVADALRTRKSSRRSSHATARCTELFDNPVRSVSVA